MRVERYDEGFVICKGRARDSYFCFLVGADSSCWTSKQTQAHQFETLLEARNYIGELRRRAHIRRVSR